MMSYASNIDPTTDSHADRSLSERVADVQIEQPEYVSTDATDAILAAVLRVFAARGRAIREECARRGIVRPESVSADQDNVGQNQQDGTDIAL